jgi:hypothetical protein
MAGCPGENDPERDGADEDRPRIVPRKSLGPSRPGSKEPLRISGMPRPFVGALL